MARENMVVGFDFSESAELTLQYAAAMAASCGALLRVVHAWNPTGWPAAALDGDSPIDRMLEEARERARQDLARTVREIARPGLDVEDVFEIGPASRVLPALAGERGTSMLLVGRHGHANMAHVLLGSVSERVVRAAPCPVLVVPKLADPSRMPRRLMVGIDYSNASREALRAARRFSTEFGCAEPLLLVNACQDEREMWLANWSEAGQLRDRKHDERSLRQWASNELPGDVPFDCLIVEGYAERMLPATAREEACDWIVVGLQGRTALASFLIGSTTQRIMKLSDRPVLVVPNQEPPSAEGVD